MCEYCGCQALQAVAELTAEHDDVVALIAQARAAARRGDLTALSAAATSIAAVLGPHVQVEERGLFPALAADFGRHVDRLVAEHRDLEAVLAVAGRAAGHAAGAADAGAADAGAADAGAADGWPARLLTALDALRDHILAEQDGAFPAALATLTPQEWDRVAVVRAEVQPAYAPDG